jgi:hypothetical protein
MDLPLPARPKAALAPPSGGSAGFAGAAVLNNDRRNRGEWIALTGAA